MQLVPSCLVHVFAFPHHAVCYAVQYTCREVGRQYSIMLHAVAGSIVFATTAKCSMHSLCQASCW